MNARSLADFSLLQGLLEAVDVVVEVPGKTLLRAASARFAAGQVSAILGPNGAGKSTLMSVLTGQRRPGGGQVRLAGQTLSGYSPQDLARVRACVAQETQVAFEFTVREVVELGRYPHRGQSARHEAAIALQAMQATAVDHLADRPLNTLSGGEKARVHLARALAQVWEPVGERGGTISRWLLLDEPTAALDLQHQHRMLQLARDWARQQGVGVVAVLHDLNLALRYSDRCVVLQGGQLVASGVTAKVLTPACIHQVWGVVAHPVPGESEGPVLQYVFEPGRECTVRHPGIPLASSSLRG
ncbi:MAG: heme ABC transporter ATP-binding protein [Polaromonas sp.]|uniref:heme ABC transporter ATP-binding protein n=1 Tax=Polaromonas sp. TaxID=1869339 RepID=UPI002733743C|nr:heme ABC transporter ATP-binding protein [Polaromonas sp.]MDP3796242.1 heme ABC transporter ATP-binding protein [Polaromonas sp.]